jgi:RNAse (barnase) inhibitor barstar
VAWQVAIVADDETEVEPLIGMLPVCAVFTPVRKAAAPELWKKWNDAWANDPALTLWSASWGKDVLARLVDEIPTVEMHHPGVACLRLFGVPNTNELLEGMASLGYFPVSGASYPGLGFAKPIDALPDVPVLTLDASSWSTRDDFYVGLFHAVGAPKWHGRNFDALIDSIQTGQINAVEVPYKIEVAGSTMAGSGAQTVLSEFAQLVGFMQSNGCPVSITLLG